MNSAIRLLTLILLTPILVLISGTAFASDPRLDQACLNWRQIGILADEEQSCTALPANGWNTRPLFDEAEGAELPRALTRYCRFENTSGNAQLSVLNALLGNGRLIALDRDCVAGTPVGDPASLSTIQWSALAAQLQEQSGALAASTTTLIGAGPVRLAVLDGNPTDPIDPEQSIGTSPHGNALITIAQSLLCPTTSPCSVNVTSRLALTFVRVDPLNRNGADRDEVNGGHLASVAELAVAVRREVSSWRAASAGDRLILNISLGWDSAFGGNEARVSAMPAAVQAMYAALYEASCHGVLTFAAAGNRSGGIDPEIGPMLPGAWEQREAPTLSECQQRLGNYPPFNASNFSGSNYRPLVYAVSGIQSDGAVLDNARNGANARLAAFADHAVVESQARAPGEPTATLTGSSVSTLLASVNAAVAWSWQPSASPHRIAELIYDAADGTTSELLRSADFCLGNAGSGLCRSGASTNMHRLSLCLTRLVMGGSGLLASDCDWNATHPALALDYAAFDSSALSIRLGTLDVTQLSPSCGGAILHYNSAFGVPAIGCPHLSLQSLGARPWVLPQPGSDLCPECEDGGRNMAKNAVNQKVAMPRVLRLQITPRLVGSVTDVVLIIANHLYRLDVGRPLVAGDRVLVHGMQHIAGDHDTAMIAFAVDGQISALSTVLLSQ